MRAARLLVPLAALAVAGCTSFTDTGASSSPSGTPSAGSPTGSPTRAAGDLAVTGQRDLGVPAADVAAARLVAGDADPAVLLVGATSRLVDGSRTSEVEGLAPSDVVRVDGGPVVVGLAADPVAGDPVLALLGPDDDAPQQLQPQRTAPRGVPVFAVAGSSTGSSAGSAVVHVLVEDADALAATVLTVDPTTGAVRDDVDLDLGDDVTSIDLVGLAATGDGLVAGLDVRAGDGSSSGRLVTLDADLRQTGDAQVLDGRLLALTADGAPVTSADLADAPDAQDARVAGAASTGSSTVVALLDRSSPTVLVTSDGDDPVTLELCDGDGDALAVVRADDGGVLVAGTCDDEAVLWTLG